MLKNLTIRTKLLVLVLGTLLSLGLVISTLAIKNTQEAIIAGTYSKLFVEESNKHAEIIDYFTMLEGLLTSMASDVGTIEAFNAFEHGFNRLHKEIHLDKAFITNEMHLDYESNYLNKVAYDVPGATPRRPVDQYLPKNINALLAQYIFITKNPAPLESKNSLSYNPLYDSSYMQAHKKYHDSFRKYLESFGLYDIFLVDTHANVIYTNFKEKDFATNLLDGVYKKSGLANVYKKAMSLQASQIAFEDFAPYEPSYNVPASFVGTPLYVKGKKVGVLIFQTPIEKINKIMNFNNKYEKLSIGKTDQSYLVGSDFKMRSNARFVEHIDNALVKKFHTTVGILEIKTDTTKMALKDTTEAQKGLAKDVNGKSVFNVYNVVTIFNQTQWALVTQVDEKEALAPLTSLKKQIFIVASIIFILISLISITLSRVLVVYPLERFQEGLFHFFEFLNEQEDTIQEIHIKSYDEIGLMSQQVNSAIANTTKNLEIKKEEAWIQNGVKELNFLLVHAPFLKNTTAQSLRFICKLCRAEVGALYLFDKESEKLNFHIGYAFTDTQEKSYSLGEGIVGEVAQNKEPLELQDIATSILSVNSATTHLQPNNVFVFPLLYQETLYGVIEVGTLTHYTHREKEFFKACQKIIATAIATATQNGQVQELLTQSDEANQSLKLEQEKLEKANAYMEEQQQHLEIANTNMEEQQQQLEEANLNMQEQRLALEVQNSDLEEAKKDLELSSKYKSEFLANMSHELRTPLNAIILLSQLLEKNRNDNLNLDDIKKAKTIFNSGNELLRLINDILDLSKVESGNMLVHVDQFNSSEFLQSISDLFEESVKEKNLELLVVDEYKGIIQSDKDRVSQIVRNLISNALKFTTEGSITITITRLDDAKTPVKISVKDTGIGIPLTQQEQIFKAFTQADGSTTRKYGGTGLGLSISKEFSALLGGTISLISQEGEGSEFIVKIANLDPSQDTASHDIVTMDTPVQENQLVTDDRHILDSQSAILVIDDDIAFSEVVYENIKSHKHFALVAHNAKDGIALAKEHNISGIMLDLTLPDMDGIEVLRILKSDVALKNIPIYIISSKDKDETLFEKGAMGYGQKPLLSDDINRVVSELETFISQTTTQNISTSTDSSLEEVSLEGLTILVVDDDIKNIFVLDSALSEYKADVLTAYNGQEALDVLHSEANIDIILMDIMMPIMDGYEAISAIRKDKNLQNMPIIAVTAKAMKEDRDKCLSIGADDFVSKPIDIESLTKLIKVWSEKRK